MNAADRSYLESQRQPLIAEDHAMQAEERVIERLLSEWSVKLAEVRARRRAIDRELTEVDDRWRQGSEIRQRMRRAS